MNYIITGGHSGMGLELTKKLLTEGHKIGLIVRSESRKKETKNLLSSENTIDIFVADLSKRELNFGRTGRVGRCCRLRAQRRAEIAPLP